MRIFPAPQTRVLVGMALSLLGATSCNLFAPLDSPSGDEQILSRARACFDRGDFDCARENYALLEGTSQAELALVESAYATLDQEGAGMKNFLDAFSSPDGGRSITRLANRMLGEGDGPTAERRANIFRAFRKARELPAASANQGLLRFLAATALTAQLLGEEATRLSEREVSRALLADDPNACEAATATCGVVQECQKTNGMPTGATAYDLWAESTTELSGTLDLQMLQAAIDEIGQGLSSLSAGGGFDGVASFSGDLAQEALVGAGGCFRNALLSQDIGSSGSSGSSD